MLSRISAFLYQAADLSSQVLSDINPNQNDVFKLHWQTITDSVTDNGSINVIKEELKEMVRMLCAEEQQADPEDLGTVGACMEFILRHKLLDTLYTAGKNNYPTGMACEVLIFFSAILGHLKRPLLHHVSIHQPILLQVKDCGLDPSSPTATEEVNFIQVLCLRLSHEPSIIDFFINETEKGCIFLLSDALLRLTNCFTYSVVMMAHKCLLLCVALNHSTANAAIASGKLSLLLASHLQYHFQLIPTNISYTKILTSQALSKLELTHHHKLDPTSARFGLCHVEMFFFWLNYCEQIVTSAQEPLARKVSESIHEVFLTVSLLPKLLKLNEEDILVSTSVLARAIQLICCRMLLEEFVMFILRDSCCHGSATIKEMIMCRINHVNEDVCQVTLQVFDSLLHTNLALVIQELTNCQSLVMSASVHANMLFSVKLKLEEDAVAYLSLLPDTLCSSMSTSGETGLSSYLRSAYCQSEVLCCECRELPQVPDCEASGEDDGIQAIDSVFVTMLLDKLEAMLDQPYQINLLVSAILVKLAAMPFNVLNSLFQTHTEHRNVYKILKKVAGTLQLRFERTPGLFVHMIEARRRLAGEVTSDLLSMPQNNLLEGAILLEEFTKELCLVLVVKTARNLLSL